MRALFPLDIVSIFQTFDYMATYFKNLKMYTLVRMSWQYVHTLLVIAKMRGAVHNTQVRLFSLLYTKYTKGPVFFFHILYSIQTRALEDEE